MTTKTPPKALSVKEAQVALGLSRSTVDRLIADGDIRAKRVGTRVLIPVEEIDRFLTAD